MLSTALIALVAGLASLLTFYSGFGLGTLLMPVVALFFPLPLAIAMTAVVHLSNNLFKLGLVGRHADLRVLLRFGVPAVLAALLGAALLGWMSGLAPVYTYEALGQTRAVAPVKLVIGIVILVFVVLERSPRFAALALPPRWMTLGGVLSGFFGGLSGHQGALRSLFLVKAGLDKHAFIATGVCIALAIDLTRLGVYAQQWSAQAQAFDWPVVIAATGSAFLGAWIGAKLLKKTTLATIQGLVTLLLVAVALGLISGFL